jgi:hypothetical protein
MRKLVTTVALLGLLLHWPGRAPAWHGPGHMTVAKIAYEELKATDPKAVTAIRELLRKHPHYDEFLSKDVPEGVSTDEWAFLRAATWPDWVRPPKHPTPHQQEIADKYNHPPWHFINFPFAVPPDATKERENQPKSSADPARPGNILEALALSKATLTKADASEEDKAVSLCWLLHLLGDIHQPLHCAMLVTSQFHPPEWDEGGNLLLVLPPDGIQVTNLHSYWDSLVLRDDPRYSAVETAAQTLRRSPKYAREALPELAAHGKPAEWAQESLQLARQVAYMNGDIKVVKGSEAHPPDNVPQLSAAYGKKATEVAEKRMVLGGYRLAGELKAVFKAP